MCPGQVAYPSENFFLNNSLIGLVPKVCDGQPSFGKTWPIELGQLLAEGLFCGTYGKINRFPYFMPSIMVSAGVDSASVTNKPHL